MTAVTCFKCHETGHYANKCPQNQALTPVRFNLGSTPDRTPAAGSGRGTPQTSSQPNRGSQTVLRGQVNHVTMEEAQTAPDVVIGKFQVNSVPATVLFDSGASHSFVSQSFALKHKLEVVALGSILLVQSPGSEMSTNLGCPIVKIAIQGVEFSADLVVLNIQSLDVILGMDWLKKHQAVLECGN